jgi:hypothetical protein
VLDSPFPGHTSLLCAAATGASSPSKHPSGCTLQGLDLYDRRTARGSGRVAFT